MSESPVDPRHHRDVVSFIRRGGRLTERQQHAWDDLAASYVLDVPRAVSSTSVDPDFRVDLAAVFGRQAPVVMEIGSGRGESLVHAAAEHPDIDFLGLEVYVPGVAQTLVTMRHENVTNVRLAVVDAVPALSTMLPAAGLEELRVWFPDPWHKKRHHKRRLVTDHFVPLAARVLRPGGVWRLATDWEDYAEQMREVLDRAEPFEFSGTWSERFSGRPITKFEAKGLAKGRTIRDLSAVRR
ncbi:tRNA (guanosine(46)-N7)-methyltransferase TrmB [Aeromicrobium phragmitis]|uniref:tRNA (guanine-N(7)-)-methyltransferase n=1 Tax=Aeromicrobium phragmitis TaxID=2478914 RepID=A0A3L8PK24_9ACTN|nr:tRNA (guanosine(46)-N7)-methyltransferase TrmB [Aeromicrobium phragmitis]RLV55707.1 tRNA (guanosine(46)-N7)-methyltransferase TrmB [Aeromicrobium phragmitis]